MIMYIFIMVEDMKKSIQKKKTKKDCRQSLTLRLSAKQGDLLKEIISEELENSESRRKNAEVQELSRVLTTVQEALNLAEYFAEMRSLTSKKK